MWHSVWELVNDYMPILLYVQVWGWSIAMNDILYDYEDKYSKKVHAEGAVPIPYTSLWTVFNFIAWPFVAGYFALKHPHGNREYEGKKK